VDLFRGCTQAEDGDPEGPALTGVHHRPARRPGPTPSGLNWSENCGAIETIIARQAARVIDIEAFSLCRFAEGKTVDTPYHYAPSHDQLEAEH